jgi:hypothetical protein
MFFSIRTVALAASLAAGFANGAVMPREESEAALDSRAFVHFFVCTDINFGGVCQNLGTNTGVCSKFLFPASFYFMPPRYDVGIMLIY